MADQRLPTARLGTHGPEVGVQGLGCMGTSFAYGPSDAEESCFTGDNAAANAALLEPARRVASRLGVLPGQVALAWVHQRAEVHGPRSSPSQAPAAPSASRRTPRPRGSH